MYVLNLMREREMFYLTTHSTHFIYGYKASDIWLRTILTVRKETHCRHIGYSYRLTARVLLYAPSHRQDNTYHGLCYTSCGALAGTRNSSMGPPHEGSIRRPIVPWANTLTTELHLAPQLHGVRHMVKDHSDSEKGNPLPPHRLNAPSHWIWWFLCVVFRTWWSGTSCTVRTTSSTTRCTTKPGPGYRRLVTSCLCVQTRREIATPYRHSWRNYR